MERVRGKGKGWRKRGEMVQWRGLGERERGGAIEGKWCNEDCKG